MGRYSGKTCRLLSMLGLTASFFLVEISVGYITNSIALVADSFHMLSDVVALIVGFASVRISKWRTAKNTFGWARAEVLGALVNAVFLIALCFSIFVEALKRLVEPEEIRNPQLLLIVGGAGLLVNIIGLFLFHDHGHSHGGGKGHGHSHGGAPQDHNDSHSIKVETEALVQNNIAGSNGSPAADIQLVSQSEQDETDSDDVVIEFDEKRATSSAQLNMRGVFLHVLGDALGSVIVIISALVIWLVEENWVYYLDPAMSILLVVIILSVTIPLLKESAFILLQTVPTHIQVSTIKDKLIKLEGVLAVHELHVWQLAGNKVIASAHIHVHNIQEFMTVAGKIKDIFHNEGIHSTTIQPEFDEDISVTVDGNCMLECGPEKNCLPNTCCAPVTNKSGKSGSKPSSEKNSPNNTKERSRGKSPKQSSSEDAV